MSRIEFSVIGSKGDRYQVVFEKTDISLHSFCDCAAGRKGSVCKHRTRLLDGEYEAIVDGNLHDLEQLQIWFSGSALQLKYARIIALEAESEQIKRRLLQSKHDFARAMHGLSK